MFSLFLQITQEPAAYETFAEPEAVTRTTSILTLITAGGPGGIFIMSILFILSIIAVYIFVERFGAIKKANKLDRNFMNNIKDHVMHGKLESATAMCDTTDTPVARMIGKGVTRIGKPLTDITQSIENQGKLEIQRLEKNLPFLATIAGGAPMIGFLGTVVGMIITFSEMANAGGQINIGQMAEGIYTAMITTVGGLFVGIFAYFGYNYLTARIEAVIYKMESSATEFLDLLHEPA